jgi:hypothetical protein
MHVFRANPHPDQPSRNAAQGRHRVEQLQDRGRLERPMRRKHLPDDAVLHRKLQALRNDRRQFAPALDLAEHVFADRARPQRRGERIGGGDRVLNG